MSVLNVLDTQTISASGSGYIKVKTGVLRCYCAAASSIQVDAGPAITLAAGEALLIAAGKPKHSKIVGATDANGSVITVEGYSNGGRHTFSVGDYVETLDGGDTDGFVAAYESAITDGKKVTAITATTITTDIDKSGAIIVTHYQGLNMPQLDELRKKMRQHGILFKITKNTHIPDLLSKFLVNFNACSNVTSGTIISTNRSCFFTTNILWN